MSALADSPRVLCIAGSPRRNGNSDRLLDALMQGVRSAGGTPVVLVARDSGVGFCRGCNACSKDGRCIQRDGMDSVYAALDAADAIAVATPVFFATVPAVLKTLLDRCQPYWARRYVLHEPAPQHRRPGAILVVGGGGDPFGAACAVNPVKSVLNVLYVRSDRIVEVLGPDKPGDIACEPQALERAAQMGTELVVEVLERR